MNAPASHEEEEDHGEVFLDESDIIQEVVIDDEGISFLLMIVSVCVCCCEFCFTNDLAYLSI